ncbi:MAG TPA: DsbA family protein, partial [Puia sp.]
MDLKNGKKNNPVQEAKGAGVEVIYYTDPLCCWSWAMEPQWKRFVDETGITITYKMGGLLPSWNNFNDKLNSIRKPIQMGPEWMHAKYLSGAEIDNRIWI